MPPSDTPWLPTPWRLEHLPRSASTNAVAADAVRRGAPAGLVVLTDHQTAGRGRLDRTWETPAGEALTFSAVVDPRVPDRQWPWLPLAVGVACCEALAELTGARAGLKWPNDVLVSGRKLAGILVERVAGPGGPLAVLGVGLNLHQRTLPVPTATSLALELGERVPPREELLAAVLAAVDRLVCAWAAEGAPDGLAASYAERSVTLGHPVRVELPGASSLRGTAEDLDATGRLLVRDGDGVLHAVGAGDVVHLRPL